MCKYVEVQQKNKNKKKTLPQTHSHVMHSRTTEVANNHDPSF